MITFPHTATLGGCTFTLVAPSPIVQLRLAAANRGAGEEDAIRLSFAALGVCLAPGQPSPWGPSPKDLRELGDAVALHLSALDGTLAAYKLATACEAALYDLLIPDSADVEEVVGNSGAPGELVSSAGAPLPDTGAGTVSAGSA